MSIAPLPHGQKSKKEPRETGFFRQGSTNGIKGRVICPWVMEVKQPAVGLQFHLVSGNYGAFEQANEGDSAWEKGFLVRLQKAKKSPDRIRSSFID
jgi:hypothetical protein